MQLTKDQLRRFLGRREKRRYIQALLRTGNEFDVEKGNGKEYLFDARSGTIQVWCRPEDKPACWDAPITAGGFGRAELVGDLSWEFDEAAEEYDLYVEVYARDLIDWRRKQQRLAGDYDPSSKLRGRTESCLTPEDLACLTQWLEEKAWELLRLTDLRPEV